MATCNPTTQLANAKAFSGLADKQLLILLAYNTAVAAGGSLDPNVLLKQSAKFQGVSEGDLWKIIALSLCTIAG